MLASRPGNPLRQQGKRPTGLLKLGECTPLSLEDGKGRRMEGVTCLEPVPQKLPCLGLRRRGVDRQPFGGKAGGPFKAPVRVGFGDSLANAFVAKILEQATTHHLADLGFVIGDKVARHATDHLGESVLPLLIPIGHLDLAARQADDCRGLGGTGNGDGQILNERVKAFGHASVAVDEVEHLVEQQQHGRSRSSEHFGQ